MFIYIFFPVVDGPMSPFKYTLSPAQLPIFRRSLSGQNSCQYSRHPSGFISVDLNSLGDLKVQCLCQWAKQSSVEKAPSE